MVKNLQAETTKKEKYAGTHQNPIINNPQMIIFSQLELYNMHRVCTLM